MQFTSSKPESLDSIAPRRNEPIPTTDEVQGQAVVDVPVEHVPLNTVLASIARDSRKQPEAFLSQVHVRHGGE